MGKEAPVWNRYCPRCWASSAGLAYGHCLFLRDAHAPYQAARDQDHIDVIINSRATTPDRTSYILGQSAENPFDIMAADAARLVTFGADVIAIPCNTAHYFYDRLNETIPIPILNMVEETVLAAKAGGSARVGILATTGTVRTRTYQRMCEKHGLPWRRAGRCRAARLPIES